VVSECGYRWWFQAAASPPFSSVSYFPLSVSVFASSSHGTGLLSMTGRKAAVGSGSRVALVVAMRIAAGGSSFFLSFFVFTSKTWQWY